MFFSKPVIKRSVNEIIAGFNATINELQDLILEKDGEAADLREQAKTLETQAAEATEEASRAQGIKGRIEALIS